MLMAWDRSILKILC